MVKKVITDDAHHHKQKPTIPAQSGDPGYGLGIAGFVTSFFVSVVGLVLSAIALKQSKRANRKNTLAFAGLIIGIVSTALHIVGFAVLGTLFGYLITTCSHDPSNSICNEQGSSYSSPYNSRPMDRFNQSY